MLRNKRMKRDSEFSRKLQLTKMMKFFSSLLPVSLHTLYRAIYGMLYCSTLLDGMTMRITHTHTPRSSILLEHPIPLSTIEAAQKNNL